MELRDYQQDLYQKTRLSFRKGRKKVLAVAPCGAGKSYLFSEMIKNTKGDALVLVHRQELKAQHEKLFRKLGITNETLLFKLAEKDAYIEGLQAGMKAMRRIVINTGEGVKK